MKLLLTITGLLLATASLLASVDPRDLTVQHDVTSATVIFRSTIPLPENSEVAIANRYGTAIYSDSVAAGNYLNKRFPVSSFNENNYSLVLTDKTGRTIMPLRFNSDKGLVVTDRVKQIVFPSIDLRSERTLVVDYQNQTGRRVNIKIANLEGETLFSDSVNGNDIVRAYQLDRLNAGNYQVIVSTRDIKNHTMAFRAAPEFCMIDFKCMLLRLRPEEPFKPLTDS